MGEEVLLRVDNCAGQNKNNIAMQYLARRGLTNLHKHITISFVVGHTKFSPNWCFGLFKRLYQRTNITSLDDITVTVNNSVKYNTAQLVVKSDGGVILSTFD